jgi:integrase
MTKYRLNKAKWNPDKPWCASWINNGQRHRRFFVTKGEAEIWIKDQNAEAKAFGSAAISDELRIEALRAEDLLKGSGASLIEAARYYADRKNIAAKSVQFHELFGHVLSYTHTQVSKGERSWEHLAGIRKVGKRMDEAFDSRMVCEIEKHEIIKWLESLTISATSKDFYRRYATSIFAFACTRQYCQSNPCHGITNSRSKSEIGILLPHEVEALLAHCAPQMVPFYAIGCFAGLRPMSELLRLSWNDIHLEERIIDVKNTKTRNHPNSPRERFVMVSENLSSWLVVAADAGDKRVVPGNWRDFIYGTRGNREVRGPGDRDRAIQELRRQNLSYQGLQDWPHDCMRHSFASYHYAKHGSADRAAEQMGHAGAQLVFKNYRRKVTPRQAEEFWSIVPK